MVHRARRLGSTWSVWARSTAGAHDSQVAFMGAAFLEPEAEPTLFPSLRDALMRNR